MQTSPLLLASAALLTTGALRAQFAEGFDSQASANVTVIAEPDTNVMFVDYSNMTIGSQTFTIPEAPRRIPGSAPTRGVLIQANVTLGTAAAVNILAGTTPMTFSGRHRLTFDAWINVPIPPPSGSTEQLLWGVGTDGQNPIEARHNAPGAQGVWGWLAGENGYSSEDATVMENAVYLNMLGDQQPGQSMPFNEAFNQPFSNGPNNAPANQWVRVDIDVDGANVRVLFNGIEFFNEPLIANPSGFAMLGYEDAFNSLNSNPDAQWGLFDNFRVSLPTCTNPGSATIQGTATAGQIMNGAAEPADGCPMTIRLRGGPSSAGALLTMGFPSPVTIPFPLGSCTLGVEVVGIIANVLAITDPLGNSDFTIPVPAGPAFCGASFGFQYFWIDSTPCGVAHSEGIAMTIGS